MSQQILGVLRNSLFGVSYLILPNPYTTGIITRCIPPAPPPREEDTDAQKRDMPC